MALVVALALAPGASSSPGRVGQEAHFAPGRYGALEVGMTQEEAVATGMVRQVYDDVCGWQLVFRRGYRRSWLVTNYETGRVLAIGTFRDGPTTTKNVGRGSPLRTVRRKYGDSLRGPHLNEYHQFVFWVRHERRRFISFFFNASELAPTSPLGSMIVSKGRPIKIFEGEGPC